MLMNEILLALIGGVVVGGVEKTDVIDPAYNTYSVKGGEWVASFSLWTASFRNQY